MRELPLGRGLVVALVALGAGGCVVAAAGAGAGGGVYLTTRGVESVVPASVDRTFRATEQAFRHFSIERVSLTVEDDGAKREVKGRLEEREADVTAKLEAANGSTRVEVTARTSLVTWDKDLAREIVEKIVEFAT
jgi:hypothetical protein